MRCSKEGGDLAQLRKLDGHACRVARADQRLEVGFHAAQTIQRGFVGQEFVGMALRRKDDWFGPVHALEGRPQSGHERCEKHRLGRDIDVVRRPPNRVPDLAEVTSFASELEAAHECPRNRSRHEARHLEHTKGVFSRRWWAAVIVARWPKRPAWARAPVEIVLSARRWPATERPIARERRAIDRDTELIERGERAIVVVGPSHPHTLRLADPGLRHGAVGLMHHLDLPVDVFDLLKPRRSITLGLTPPKMRMPTE